MSDCLQQQWGKTMIRERTIFCEMLFLLYFDARTLFFLLKDSYQGKIVCKSITIVWLWSDMPSHVQTCMNVLRGEFGWSRGGKVTF